MNINSLNVNESNKNKRWWDDDGDRIGYEKGEVSGSFRRKRKKKKVEEELVGKQYKLDVNKNNQIDSQDLKILRKRKKSIKEGYSNWRFELSEISEYLGKDKNDEKIVEKEVNNKIKINPTIGESVKNLGGTLLEMNKIENIQEAFEYLSESEIFFLNDTLIETVVEEVFIECIEEGYNISDIENALLESLEISTQILSESEQTQDNKAKTGKLEKVKTAVKNVGKKLVRGVGYVAGATVRGAKSAGRELVKGYQRGRRGKSSEDDSSSSESSSSSSDSGGSSRSSSTTPSQSTSTSDTQSTSSSSKPGLLSRIASKLGRGLRKIVHRAAKSVEKGARYVRNKTDDSQRERDLLHRAMYDRVKNHPDHGTPSSAHSRTGTRSPNIRRGIGGGKRIEVTGSSNSANSSQASVGTSSNPRVGQPGPNRPRTSTRTTTVRPTESPSSVHSKAGNKPPSTRSGIGGGKKVEVAGSHSAPKETIGKRPTPILSSGKNDSGSTSEPKRQTRRPRASNKKTTVATPQQSNTNKSSRKKSNFSQSTTSTKVNNKKSKADSKKSEPNPQIEGLPSLDDLLKKESYQLTEKTLTAAETKKKEEIVMSMKKNLSDMIKRYGSKKRAMEVIYATATKMAKKIEEQSL